jgi:hypothetical protein
MISDPKLIRSLEGMALSAWNVVGGYGFEPQTLSV